MQVGLEVRIAESFEYRDGKLFWKSISKFHRDRLGAEVGGPVNSRGKRYWSAHIDGKTLKRHQVVFCLFNGYIPKMIDHIDGDSTNDRIENLREANYTLNNRNHGRRNIRKIKSSGKYQVRLGQQHIGNFLTFDEAVKAYDTTRSLLWKT